MGIDYTTVYLERFFRNLLLGEKWDLRNRYLHINATDEWKVQPNLADGTSTVQVPEQVKGKLHTSNENIIRLVVAIGENELSVKQMMAAVGLKHRPNFLEYSIKPAISEGFVCLLHPDSPRHPRQKYLLTVKGLALYNELKKEK